MLTVQDESQIAWLDDKPQDVIQLIETLGRGLNREIDIYDESKAALRGIRSNRPAVFIVDLLLGPTSDSGFDTAVTAKVMHPTMPIVAVTEHLPNFYADVSRSLVQGIYPFAEIWEKSELSDASGTTGFVDTIRHFCLYEHHIGTVTEMLSDYSRVELYTPKGEPYGRLFDTSFLNSIGVAASGDSVELVFSKSTHDVLGAMVCMQVTKREIRPVEEERVPGEIVGQAELDRIREKFGSIMED